MRTKLLLLTAFLLSSSAASTAHAGDGICTRAADFAFLRPQFLDWYIDRRDPGACSDESLLEEFWQWGLPETDRYLAGEPLSGFRDGYDELIVYRRDFADPSLGRWWVLHNDQMPGYSGDWTEGVFGFWDDHPLIINRDGASGDRAAVKQGDLLIIDTNSTLTYEVESDQIFSWPVPVAQADSLFASDVVGQNFEDLVVWCADTGNWEFYLFFLTPDAVPTHVFNWGQPGDFPAIGDLNADGHEDLIFFRPSTRVVHVNLWEEGDPNSGYAPSTDCVLNYASLLGLIDSGSWDTGFVAVNYDAFDDSDGDDIDDCDDNCPDHVNPDQDDCDSDGIGDVCAIATGASEDCNDNEVPDDCELEGNDCNDNGIPDDCELDDNDCNDNMVPDDCELEGNDCNDNGMPDECDLEGNDCNKNGVPDDCELNDNDCNDNGVPDDCELADNDCNENDVPDDCDIAQGTSVDCARNGIPDECECLADLSGNGAVGFGDLVDLLAAWGVCGPPCDADLDCSGAVDFPDLLQVLSDWGPCE